MNRDKLDRALQYLEGIQEEDFDITAWTNRCGTVCCAGGWICRFPEFNAMGLGLADRGRGTEEPYFRTALGIELWGFEALARFFEISPFLSMALFSPDFYTPHLHSVKAKSPYVSLDQIRQRIFQLIHSPCP